MVSKTVAVSDAKYAKTQGYELEYWQNAIASPLQSWGFYDTFFSPYYQPYEMIIDVGCGPVPYVLNPILQANVRMISDPLWEEYMKIKRYRHLARGIDCYYLDITTVPDIRFDAVFALNMLDHVKDIEDMLYHLHRILKVCGDLYLFVDVDKPPDHLHPHDINKDWLLNRLLVDFQPIFVKTMKSWKFDNDILYYIGRKKTCLGTISS